MDEITSALLVKALDGLSTRYNYIAQNIANISTENYQPLQVRFEDQLSAMVDGASPEEIRSLRPVVSYQDADNLSSGVRLDMELATASQNAMRYRAIVNVLGRQVELARVLIRGGQ